MITIYVGDCREVIPQLPTVNYVLTSPPYWGLRKYSGPMQLWDDGWKGQLGMEPTPELYVQHLAEIMELIRTGPLEESGVAWLNLGDSYAAAGYSNHVGTGGAQRSQGGKQRHTRTPGNLKPKDLIGIPWQAAFALRDLGWYLRSDIIWAKGVSGQDLLEAKVRAAIHDAGFPDSIADKVLEHFEPFVGNPMPGSMRDRPASAHEYVFMLSRSRQYIVDWLNSREPAVNNRQGGKAPTKAAREGQGNQGIGSDTLHQSGKYRNQRDVWEIVTKGYSGAHFAVMSPLLVEQVAKWWEWQRCYECKKVWSRQFERVDKSPVMRDGEWEEEASGKGVIGTDGRGGRLRVGLDRKAADEKVSDYITLGWQATCKCCDAGTERAVVLDPFGGAGTTALIAEQRGLDTILIEISHDYAELARSRIAEELPDAKVEVLS